MGNARTFLMNWLMARRQGWRIILRIEDLDGPRIKTGADRELIEDLRWLGLDWDAGPIYQSGRRALYQSAVQKLIDSGLAYPCVCTRREIEAAASAPHAEDGSAMYPGTCLGRYASIEEATAAAGRPPAVRVHVRASMLEFDDGFAGRQSVRPARELGDFVVRKADGTPAYQLAVVVDDADMRVTQVVRGDDLLESTPRQIFLYHSLGFPDRVPRFTHVPLVIGTDGKRLAKRHGDTRLSYYRQKGVSPERVLALLGRWCGVSAGGAALQTHDLLQSFRLSSIPRGPIVFTPADDAWLLAS